MGMDLVGKKPRNEDGQDIHMNWCGWGVFCTLLECLGCDLSELSGSNDGNPVKAKTARDFAKAIRKGLKQNRIFTEFVPANHYAGGGYDGIFAVESSPGSKKATRLKKDLNIHQLKDDDRKWLEEVCSFLENCGGFRQY